MLLTGRDGRYAILGSLVYSPGSPGGLRGMAPRTLALAAALGTAATLAAWLLYRRVSLGQRLSRIGTGTIALLGSILAKQRPILIITRIAWSNYSCQLLSQANSAPAHSRSPSTQGTASSFNEATQVFLFPACLVLFSLYWRAGRGAS